MTILPDWPVFRVGFRPFFLLGMVASILLMGAWMAFTQAGVRPAPLIAGSAIWWHAHEMIYGYALAVAAGFLLTAVRNWTGLTTARGGGLAGLVLLWIGGRILPWLPLGPHAWLLAGVADALFVAGLSAAVLRPLILRREWARMGIVSKVVFFLPGQVMFMLGVSGRVDDGERMGVMIGLYVLLSLMLVLARRLLPMFIERATGASALINRRWVDLGCFVLFLAFAIVEVFDPDSVWGTALAGILAVLHLIRMAGWHVPAIWRMPMLWSLYLAYGWVVVGLLLRAAAGLGYAPASLAIHAFTVGGIGMMTLGMMVRITLGHTGRQVMRPPAVIPLAFALMLIAALARVAGIGLAPAHAAVWMGAAQTCWILAFALALASIGPMLWRERADGRWG